MSDVSHTDTLPRFGASLKKGKSGAGGMGCKGR